MSKTNLTKGDMVEKAGDLDQAIEDQLVHGGNFVNRRKMARTPPQGTKGTKDALLKETRDPPQGTQGGLSEAPGRQGTARSWALPGFWTETEKSLEEKGTQSQDEDRDARKRRQESVQERTRAYTVPDCRVLITRQEDKEKRKRTEDSPGDGNNPKKGSRKKQCGTTVGAWDSQYSEGRSSQDKEASHKEYNKLREFMELLNGMLEEIKELRTLATENQNTKVEIKKSSGLLEDMAAQIDAEDYLASLKALIDSGEKAASLTQPSQKQLTSLTNASTQTDREPWQIRNDKTVEAIRAKIAKCDDLSEVLEITRMEWPKEAFKKTKMMAGNPI